jgi:hypothetical protein
VKYNVIIPFTRSIQITGMHSTEYRLVVHRSCGQQGIPIHILVKKI